MNPVIAFLIYFVASLIIGFVLVFTARGLWKRVKKSNKSKIKPGVPQQSTMPTAQDNQTIEQKSQRANDISLNVTPYQEPVRRNRIGIKIENLTNERVTRLQVAPDYLEHLSFGTRRKTIDDADRDFPNMSRIENRTIETGDWGIVFLAHADIERITFEFTNPYWRLVDDDAERDDFLQAEMRLHPVARTANYGMRFSISGRVGNHEFKKKYDSHITFATYLNESTLEIIYLREIAQ